MKQNLQLIESEEKWMKNGKLYSRFKTNGGWMSCFDEKQSKTLKEHMGKWIEAEIKVSGDFSNIVKFCNVLDIQNGTPEIQVERPGQVNPVTEVKAKTGTATYTKCAVELYIEAYKRNEFKITPEELMAHCVDIVKIARDKLE